MIRDEHNVIPVSLAVLLHVVVFGSLIIAIDFAPRPRPVSPLAIKATLLVEESDVAPIVKEPEPEPEAEPEPEPPKPDPDEEARIKAEQEKRLEDERIERERQQRIKQQEEEKKRLAAEAEQKRLKDEVERKRREEEDKERKRVEAEKQRQEDIKRQREENERRRREEEDAIRQAEIDAEEALTAARNSHEQDAYVYAIQQKVIRSWARPASARPGLECVVRVRQVPGGEVVGVNVVSCNGDEAVVRSIEAAVRKASPLPIPANPILFERDLRFVFKPEQ